MRSIRLVRAAFAAALLAAGCADPGPQRVVVTGEVSYKGVPVKQGEIRFFPKEGTNTPMSGAYIKDGRYTADGLGGVPVGTFSVDITAFRNARDTSADIEKQSEGGQYLPAKFNSKTTLEATIPAARGPVTQDFHLKD